MLWLDFNTFKGLPTHYLQLIVGDIETSHASHYQSPSQSANLYVVKR